MPPGRPAKPNKVRLQVKLDEAIATALTDAARLIGTDRSQLIEDLAVKYLPRHLDKLIPKPKHRD